jgi:hypothetical protein
MKLSTKMCLTAAALLGLLTTSMRLSAQNTSSQIISLDAPGADTTAGSFNGTYAMSINNSGVITGSYIDVNDVNYGFLRAADGKYTTFQAPGADTTAGSYNGTSPSAINDLGVVTGSYADAKSFDHGFLRGPQGKFTTFDVPGAGGYGTLPIGINLEGTIVGYYTDANYLFHAFARSPDGKFVTFVGPGSCDSNPNAGCYGTGAFTVNIFQTIAGGYQDNSGNLVHHALVRTPGGQLTTFEAPGSGNGNNQGTGCPGCAPGLNQWGAIAGTYTDTNNVYHGYLRSPQGKFTTFDAPGAGGGANEGTGCPSDCPVSLNDFGAITGIYIDANDNLHGYLRSPEGKFTTVDGPGSLDMYFVNLNDWGSITGYYIDANDVYHGFLRIP